jgi:hypothetical protein
MRAVAAVLGVPPERLWERAAFEAAAAAEEEAAARSSLGPT